MNIKQLHAASKMIVTLERIVSAGVLHEHQEADTRELIRDACEAFEIPTISERKNVRVEVA